MIPNPYYILSPSNDPYFNLAADEYFMRNLSTENTAYLFLYSNTDSVVLGKNQNVFEEVHWDYLQHNEVKICRRISGGGCVVHDMENLNFSFIAAYSDRELNGYEHSTKKLTETLNDLSVACYIDDRKAIRLSINDKKISGSAQFTNRRNILSHCTLLIHSNLENLKKYIKKNNAEIISTGSKSVRSEVDTIQNQYPAFNYTPTEIAFALGYNKEYLISENEIAEIEKLAQEKYTQKSWIIDRSPACTIKDQTHITEIRDGKIVSQTPHFEENTYSALVNLGAFESLI